jgi:hypothetical protein
MNKEEMLPFVKAIAEIDKKFIDEDKKYNLSKDQKEILKQFVDECYENFKKSK